MGKKGHGKDHDKKKLTKKEIKKMNHLKLMQGKKGKGEDLSHFEESDQKKAA